MNKLLTRIVVPVLVTAVVLGGGLFALGFGWLSVPDVQAQEQQPVIADSQPGAITVVGEGKVSLEPDIARVSIGVETVNESVLDATAQNREVLDSVLNALREAGIAEEDLQTSGFSVYAERYGPEGPLAESDVRYRVSNNVSVTIRDLENVGSILDAAIEAGANNIYGINFALEDPGVAEADARELAIADAREKAENIAELAGLEISGVSSVSEVIGMGGGYYAGTFSEQALGGGGGTPVSPGQLDLVMQLQVIFAAQ
jgi:uncharacterized protein YggE